jgi:membrane protein YqaA with SNARE-associated domain
LTEELVGQLGYFGIALVLVLGGLGLPIPEEAPIILAAVLSKSGKMWWPLALAACMAGVLIGDFIVYALGYVYGEKVMSLPLTRKVLSPAREAQIQGYFHRHGFKILILGRFAVGFRTAVYLTAGILKLPVIKLFLTDLLAASLLHRYYHARQRAGQPVGPNVLVARDAPLPPDDLRAKSGEFRALTSSPPTPTRREPEPLPDPPPPVPVSPATPANTGPVLPLIPAISDRPERASS